MLSDEIVSEMEEAVAACDDARSQLEDALNDAEAQEEDDAQLQSVATALEAWRDAQRRFMDAVERSDAPDVSTATMMLKTNHGTDATNARRGLPGAHVEGTDQPFDVDLSGTRGTILTTAAMEYVS